jgi:FkbM family methyltransferase
MTSWLAQLLSDTRERKREKTPWLDGFAPILIYGTGAMAQDIQRVLTDHGLPVYGFIDHMERPTASLIRLPIFEPENVRVTSKTGGSPVVVLGLHNYQVNVPQITQRLNANNLDRIVSTVELYDYFGAELGTRYWLTSRDFYPPLESVLEECLALWSDDESERLFRSILEFRMNGDAALLPAPDLVNPYHPVDIPEWKKPLRFVDCGAFDGDTLADFIRNNIPLEAVAAFEPDLVNFGKLSRFISQNGQIPNACLWPCGVYSSTTQLTFETGQGMGSNISKTGSTVIQCVALDDVLPNFAPNLIKMDIEGAEYNALLGARNLIAAHLPGLAVSLYHRPEHLWQLPLLVETIVPGKYRFFMRAHALNDFELVLYAIPA